MTPKGAGGVAGSGRQRRVSGQHAAAEHLAGEAISRAAATDLLNVQADAYSDLAEVLALAHKTEDVSTALKQALERYERKGNIVMAERTRARLADAQAIAAR
jgi:hypothetical protein